LTSINVTNVSTCYFRLLDLNHNLVIAPTFMLLLAQYISLICLLLISIVLYFSTKINLCCVATLCYIYIISVVFILSLSLHICYFTIRARDSDLLSWYIKFFDVKKYHRMLCKLIKSYYTTIPCERIWVLEQGKMLRLENPRWLKYTKHMLIKLFAIKYKSSKE
jgi:hypothetical protein